MRPILRRPLIMSLIVAVCGGTGGALTGRAGADDPRGGDPTLVAGEVRTLGEPTSLVYAVAFKADASRIASVARGLRIVRVWDGVTGRSLIDFSEEEPNFNVGVAPAVAVAFGPAHAQIVTGGPRARIYDGGTRCWSGGAIRFWDMASKEKLHNLYDFETFIMGIAVGVDGRRVAAIDYHGTYRAWSTASWGEIDSVRFPSMIEGSSSTASTKISFSADACRAAAIADEPDRRRFRQLVLFDGPRRTARPIAEGYYCAAMSRRGEFVAAGIGPDRLSVLAFETGRTLLEASTESVGAIYFLGFSPDDDHIVVGGDDVLLVLSRRSGRPVARARGPKGKVRAVAFVPGGLRVVSGGIDDMEARDARGFQWCEPLKLWGIKLNLSP